MHMVSALLKAVILSEINYSLTLNPYHGPTWRSVRNKRDSSLDSEITIGVCVWSMCISVSVSGFPGT